MSRPTFTKVSTPEVESMAELIADCADIPATVRTAPPDVPSPRAAAAWSVDETCLAQAPEFDDYL
jgi:hypothetical protein